MAELMIKFPNGEIRNLQQGKPVVLLGANGAGKTRLSVKIEELNDTSFQRPYNPSQFLVQRLSAQKSLSISDTLIIKGLEASTREAYIGNSNEYASKIGYRYGSNPATFLINDYDKVLSLLFAKNNKLLEDQNKMDKLCVSQGKTRPEPLKTLIDIVEEIWSYLLPNRKIDLSGNEVHAIWKNRYHGKEMSDGERVILYMIVQALTVKDNTLVIIDEPELHIHKAILNKLWDKLEEIRQDCVFMYITHDLDFAVSRNTDEILWVKSFDGDNTWEYEFLNIEDYESLSTELIFEIIGTKKKIVFVEGTKSSLDYLLYQEIYKDKNYHVIPCGGCKQVVNYVKAKKGYGKFDNIEVYGVVDRDYRMKHEVDELKNDGIFCLEVSEVENLFLVPELLLVMQKQLGCEDDVVDNAKKFIVDLYNGVKETQIKEAFTKEVDYQLSCMHFDSKTLVAESVKKALDEKFTIEFIECILKDKREIFESATELDDILRIFNFKDLSKKIGSKFGIKDSEYPKRVINLLKYNKNGVKEQIIDAVKPYIPELP
ncbi:AAA domain-containing protein, putative AbiEii toxin, Type IV TA system [Acetoanaerobium noterae]|uniref:AAA domain-containing protein, putative AbiEii toxin, Type IV TA system n=1 Tax=Acetoanaerobium noterae TaxID=745369 RepID=A0A1T5CZJ4_9FIRM|nr:DUF4435 domain-containing protein [Acetoanaerobium noterae]SKB64819.1 AAA domain-containing protein, putative AbiEii toxin, Type IV TA system [Acetoanaerobium noterae]